MILILAHTFVVHSPPCGIIKKVGTKTIKNPEDF